MILLDANYLILASQASSAEQLEFTQLVRWKEHGEVP